jgi:predicted GNAT family N-acyltransferase
MAHAAELTRAASPARRRYGASVRGPERIRSGDVELRWAAGGHDRSQALSVREEVFCGEQGVPRALELDGLDDHALHLLALPAGAAYAVGTLRLLLDGTEAKVGRVAVQRRWRGRGIASRMLAAALATAADRGCRSARLAAQLQATALYERAGFTLASEPFEQAGIAHVWMRRNLTDPA